MSVLLYAKKPWGVCKCGHFQWQHGSKTTLPNHKTVPKVDGHGECNHEECFPDMKCRQFTWVRFATKKEMEP